jgi:ABC-type arginine/histidine transport system permease subunit
MKRPSLPLATLIIFWFVYGVVAAYALYQALPRLNRELLLILGGAAIFPVVAIFTILLYARSRHSIDDRPY